MSIYEEMTAFVKEIAEYPFFDQELRLENGETLAYTAKAFKEVPIDAQTWRRDPASRMSVPGFVSYLEREENNPEVLLRTATQLVIKMKLESDKRKAWSLNERVLALSILAMSAKVQAELGQRAPDEIQALIRYAHFCLQIDRETIWLTIHEQMELHGGKNPHQKRPGWAEEETDRWTERSYKDVIEFEPGQFEVSSQDMAEAQQMIEFQGMKDRIYASAKTVAQAEQNAELATRERNKSIREALRRGLTQVEIQRIAGISQGRVSQILKSSKP